MKIVASLANPFGPRVWAGLDQEAEVLRAFPEYSIISAHWDVCGYLYRLQVQQLRLLALEPKNADRSPLAPREG